jgi:hypothetical protein
MIMLQNNFEREELDDGEEGPYPTGNPWLFQSTAEFLEKVTKLEADIQIAIHNALCRFYKKRF